MNVLNRIAGVFTQFVTPVYVLRAPLLTAMLAVVALAVPDQTLELYRAIALDRADRWPQILLAYTTLTLAGAMLWYIGRTMTLRWQRAQLVESTISGFLLRWLPRLYGAAPLSGAAIGIFKSASLAKPLDPSQWREGAGAIPEVVESIAVAIRQYETASSLLYFGASVALGLGILLVLLTFLRSYHKRWKYEDPNPWVFGLPIRIFFYVLTLVLVLSFSAFFLGAPGRYGRLADELGVFTIFNLFLICTGFFLGALTNIYDRTKLPALSLLVLTAFIVSALDLNDNHSIRITKTLVRLNKPADTQFADWIASRPDRAHFKARNEPYPVYIVAAQGGGIYAAEHVAVTLARMQDRCPSFAQHIFAISGVSGGGLGGALFSSLVKEKATAVADPKCQFGPQDPGWYEERTREYLRQDFLSPLAAAGLFPDFLQRFIPFPIEEFDRARALEAAMEGAWNKTMPDTPGNPFAESYFDHWDAKGNAPAVVLNVTRVSTGGRVLIAPFKFTKDARVRLDHLSSIVRRDLALSTAVGIGARFPWILPPASFVKQPDQYYRFVDGGYFESSGMETALDLVAMLEDYQRKLQESAAEALDIKIHLVMLTTDTILEDPFNTDNASREADADTGRSGFDEYASPLTAMFESRWERGVVSAARAVDKFCLDCFRDREDRRVYAGIDGDARLFRLNFTDFVMTLGWQLSRPSQEIVSVHAGYADRCLAGRRGLRRKWAWAVQVLNENNCAACQMMYVLTGRARELETIAPTITGTYGKSRTTDVPNWIKLCRQDAASPSTPAYAVPGAGASVQ